MRPRLQDPAGVDRPLELRRLLSRFVDVCNTVAYAHSRGVLHRDLKPGNIILDEYGETLVVDWGLAKTDAVDVESASGGVTLPPVSTSSTPYTRAGATMGTPGFMSPEQAAGRLSELGPASDVYSLGATLYCLLTGKPPPTSRTRRSSSQGPRGGVSAAPPGQVDRAGCARGDLLESDGPLSGRSILQPQGTWRRNRALAGRSTGSGIPRAVPCQGHSLGSPAQAMGCGRGRDAHPDRARTGDPQLANHQGESKDDRSTRHDPRRTPGAPQGLGENLAFMPNTENLREHLAQLVLDRYQQLGDKFPTDPGVRLETAQVFRVIGGIGRLTGQFAKSQASYEKAIQGLTTLCENDPGQADYRRWLVEAFIDRGELNHMNGRTIDAEKDFHAAIGHADKLRPPLFVVYLVRLVLLKYCSNGFAPEATTMFSGPAG